MTESHIRQALSLLIRLSEVYTVNTDQAALINLVDEARKLVGEIDRTTLPVSKKVSR